MTIEEAINRMNTTDSLSELCDMVLLARELIEKEYQKNKSRIFRVLNTGNNNDFFNFDAPMVNGDANANQHNSNALNGVGQRTNALEGDAVSRQAVLEGLASIAKAKARSDAQKALMGRVMFFTEHLSSVNPQEPRWIPVSERLPKDGQSVLFCDIDNDIMVGYHVKGRPDTHFSQDGTYDDMKDVRAWMPLPKPYEPQATDKDAETQAIEFLAEARACAESEE